MKRTLRWTLVGGVALALLGGVVLSGAQQSSCVPVEPSGPVLEQLDEVSECGGFVAMQKADDATFAPDDYCDAEVLDWAYDAATQSLALHDERVFLNCCGEHAMEVTYDHGLYVVRETDEPVEGAGRCDCMCVFDFHLDVSGVPDGIIALRLDRFVTESGEETVWEGTLDLTLESGRVVVDDTDVGMWCP